MDGGHTEGPHGDVGPRWGHTWAMDDWIPADNDGHQQVGISHLTAHSTEAHVAATLLGSLTHRRGRGAAAWSSPLGIADLESGRVKLRNLH
jgi:hypothetical protein